MVDEEIEMLRRDTMSRRANRYGSVTAAFVFAIGLAWGCDVGLAAPPSVLLFADRDLGEALASHLDTNAMPSPTISDAAIDQACGAAPADIPRFAVVTHVPLRAALEDCARRAEADVKAVEIGRQAVALVAPAGAPVWSIGTAALFRALGEHGSNRHPQNWSDVAPDMPKLPIGLLAPPPGSRAEALLQELVMATGCASVDHNLPFDLQERTAYCGKLRQDITTVRRAGNIEELEGWANSAPPGQVAVVTLAELRQLSERVVPLPIDSALPTTGNLEAMRYPAAASVSLLIVVPHTAGKASRDAARKVAFNLLAESVIGPEGTLAPAGLAPLAPADRVAARTQAVATLEQP